MTHYNLLAAQRRFCPIQSGGTESTFEYNSTWKAHSFTYTGSEQTLTISNLGSEGKLSIICIGVEVEEVVNLVITEAVASTLEK